MKLISKRFLGEGTHATYPHCNGFAPDGRHLLCMQMDPEGSRYLGLRYMSLENERSVFIPFPESAPVQTNCGDSAIWHDVALAAPVAAVLFGNAAWILDLSPGAFGEWKCLYLADSASGHAMHSLPSLSADGRRLLVGETRADSCDAIEIDVRTGLATRLFSKPWLANHFHYCPFDESWIGFSHEGAPASVPDRCWGWHAREAPDGRNVFDQSQASRGRAAHLFVGHERWTFHDRSAYAVAYGTGPVNPCGLYEAFADGRPARLLWHSDLLWHCNMDASGRFAAIDTSAPWNPAPPTEAEHPDGEASRISAVGPQPPSESDVALLDLRGQTSLRVASVGRKNHPWHPHPAFNKDAQYLVYNDAGVSRRGAWLARLLP